MKASYRDLFYLPDDLIYLNCAYMAPLLKEVEDIGIAAIRQRRNPGSITPDHFFNDSNEVREIFGRMVNAPANRIVLVPSVSYGLANVSGNLSLRKGQKIVVAGAQFPSNYYPWKRVADGAGVRIEAVLPDPSLGQGRGASWNEKILEAIDQETALVALAHVHWADGSRFDLSAIRSRTREVGALMIIDGTQSVGALPFDVQELQPDALVCAGYKWLMGPYSLGLAYYGEAFDGGIPVEENWINRLHSEDFTGLVSYEENYQPGALRYEMGEHSNFNLVPMLKRSLSIVEGFTPERIQTHCREICTEAFTRLAAAGCTIDDEAHRASHLVGIRLPADTDSQALKDTLASRKISVSFRGNAIRVAPHLYNDDSEMEEFASLVIRSIKQKAHI